MDTTQPAKTRSVLDHDGSFSARLAADAFRRLQDAATVDAPLYVAVDPSTRLHLRAATAEERAAYTACNAARCGLHFGHAFDAPVRVGGVLVDTWTGWR